MRSSGKPCLITFFFYLRKLFITIELPFMLQKFKLNGIIVNTNHWFDSPLRERMQQMKKLINGPQ